MLEQHRIAFGAWTCFSALLLVTACDKSDKLTVPTPLTPTPILFESGRDGNYEIYVMNSDGTSQTRLTNGGGNRDPAWSPTREKIAFYNEDLPGPGVYIMSSDGTDQKRLANGDSPDWSPDGTKIVFSRYQNDSFEVYVMNTDGSNQERLTTNGYSRLPAWSPDGAKIAFVSGSDSSSEIYVMNADGSAPMALTQNQIPDSGPPGLPMAPGSRSLPTATAAGRSIL